MRISFRKIIEKVLPEFFAKKIIFLVKNYRHKKSEFYIFLVSKVMPQRLVSFVRFHKRLARDRKRLSYGNGKPFTKEINVLGISFKMILNPSLNCLVDESIAQNGFWEKDLSNLFLKYIKPNCVFLDIGANIGYHSLFVASLLNGSGKVYSFEPLAHLCSQLRESIKLNNFINIEVCNFGLAENNSEHLIHIRDENTGGSSLINLANMHRFKIKSTEKVTLKKLDDFLDENTKVDLIKIDVEGYEYEALKGGVNMLRNSRPVIFMEFSPMFYVQDYANKPYELISFLRSLGYSFFSLDEKKFDIEGWLEEPHNINSQIDIICKVV